MTGNQNCFAFVGKAAEDFYDFVGAFGIYRVSWFIGQENLRIVDEGIEDLSFWFIPALPAKIPAGLRVAYATFKSKVPQIANAYSTKPEFVQNIVNFFKKKANDGLKKETESNAPRIQNTPQEVMDYIKGLTDKKGYILNRGNTKDGYHYYEVMKKFTYKGRDFRKGEYISRDTRHHEIEHFRDKDYHYGALDPVKGNLKPGSQVPERRLHLK